MHPVIKIISLIILSVFTTQGDWPTLLLTGALVLPFYFIQPAYWKSAAAMIWRLKWFFLSILLIYVFFTPGTSASQTHLNTWLVLLLPGLFRILVLITLILAVNLLIKTTSKDEMLTALLWIFSPLRWFHIDIDRFLLRAVLTIEYIELLNQKLSQIKQRKKNDIQAENWLIQKRRAFYQLVDNSNVLLQELFAEVSKSARKEYHINALEQPRLMQWGIPASLIFILSLIAYD